MAFVELATKDRDRRVSRPGAEELGAHHVALHTKTLSRRCGHGLPARTDGELNAIDHFMRQIGRLNELDLDTVVLADAGAGAGRELFLTVGCNHCHGDAVANASSGGGGKRNFDTGVESARNAALQGFPHAGGFGRTSSSSIPKRDPCRHGDRSLVCHHASHAAYSVDRARHRHDPELRDQ